MCVFEVRYSLRGAELPREQNPGCRKPGVFKGIGRLVNKGNCPGKPGLNLDP